MESWKIGAVVSGCELLAELGRGGMGVVYRARELSTGREVALKTLSFHDPEEAARLEREGQALAQVAHPNLLRVHRAERHAGRPLLVLELASGGSLAQRLEGGAVPWPEAVESVARLADGLAAAHAAGVVHRDVKPGNVLLDAAGVPKLADFGLVRLDNRTRLTETGTVLGTPSYMAPEQARGEPAGPPADVYGLAGVLYRCVAGTPPLGPQRNVLLQLAALQSEVPPLLPGAPAWLQELVARALDKDPAARPSAAELAQALRAGERAGAARPRALGPAGAAYLSGLALALCALGLGLGVAKRASEAPRSPLPQRDPAAGSPAPQDAAPARTPSLAPLRAAYADFLGELRAAEESAGLRQELALAADRGDLTLALVKDVDRRQKETLVAFAAPEEVDPRVSALAAWLTLAGRGYLDRGVQMARGISFLSPRGTRYLLEAARLGSSRALRVLGRKHPTLVFQDRDYAAALYYAGLSIRFDWPAERIRGGFDEQNATRRRGPLAHPGAAWREVWEREHPEAPALRELAAGRGRMALAALLAELEAGGGSPLLLEQIQRVAELVWLNDLRGLGQPYSLGLAEPARPAGATRAEMERVLAQLTWPRGRYLRALLELPSWWPGNPHGCLRLGAPAREAILRLLGSVARPPCPSALFLRAALLASLGRHAEAEACVVAGKVATEEEHETALMQLAFCRLLAAGQRRTPALERVMEVVPLTWSTGPEHVVSWLHERYAALPR